MSDRIRRISHTILKPTNFFVKLTVLMHILLNRYILNEVPDLPILL